MNAVTELALENIRCFAGEQAISLPRVAVLVGENNTGKSTFLACCSALAELSCNERVDRYDPFNSGPFDMGGFETIARRGGDGFALSGRVGEVDLSFRFAGEESQLVERAAVVRAGEIPELRVERDSPGTGWRLTGPSYDFPLEAREISYLQFSQWLALAVRRGHLPYGRDPEAFKGRAERTADQVAQFALLSNHLSGLSANLPPSKPALRAVPPTIGMPARWTRDVPLVASMEEFDQFKERLREAGERLGLFSGIAVTEMPGGGYGLEVAIDNHVHSIADAGFGVHSVLPCLKAIVENSDATVLMQQPETHLHPMAQALLSQLIAESSGRYIIETHADHIIKRLSICIRKEEISPEEVVLFWFEKNGEEGTRIHPISFDEIGNLVDAPRNYRKFFIRERKDFLGFE